MKTRTLGRILREVLSLTAVTPLTCLVASCGGRAIEPAAQSSDAGADAQPSDAQPSDGQSADSPFETGDESAIPCAGQSCGFDCPGGCTMATECIGNVLQCRCACPQDGEVVDVVTNDAPDPCHPDHNLCPYYVPFSCLDAEAPDAASGSQQQCAVWCSFSSPSTGFCSVGTDPSGQPAAECYAQCGVGRRPAGMARPRRRQGSLPGRFFAAAAKLEAASVDAFLGARSQLASFGAPAHLLLAAERAARDEVRHARSQGSLARRYGVEPRMPRVRRGARLTLEAFALENAVEGCVRETYGALVALHQAQHARDGRVREAMRRIATDEIRHAALSWQIARWLEDRLDAPTRLALERARRRAVRDLRRTAKNEPPPALRSIAGLPGAREAASLVDGLDRALWSAS
jgi:hypothetical protein